ncbi:MAG: hypothetical protein HY906_04980 [Deltaproteobacteria bacterium]|nr:hypothetical protein [Deltaproteobacteria bacterium]
MPSPFHQVLVSLFRERPRLAADLLRYALGVRLAPGTRAAVADATVSELAPADYHPDLVLVHRHGASSRPRYGIVLEVQLARRRHKQFTWPLYAAAKQEAAAAPPPPAATAEVAAATTGPAGAPTSRSGTRPLAETLRGELPYHEQIRLGLVTPRSGRRSDPENPATPPAPSGNE